MSRAARPVGVLVAILLLIGRRLLNADSAPIRFQFVGDNEGHPGAHALAHFRAMHDDGDPAVLTHGQEHQWVVDGAMRHAVGAVLGRIGRLGDVQAVRDQQQAAHRSKLAQEFAPTQALRCGEFMSNSAHLARLP